MALLTAAELKSSREAIEAGVDSVTDTVATAAITEATAELYSLLGFKIEDATTSFTFRGTGHTTLYLPQRSRTVSAITEDGTTATATEYHLSDSGWLLKRETGSWSAEAIVVTGTFGFTASDDEWIMAKKAVRILAVMYLASSSADLPIGARGAFLTGFSSESASYQMFTPDSDSGHPDVDRLVTRIREASAFPLASKKTLHSIPLQGAYGDVRPYVEQ